MRPAAPAGVRKLGVARLPPWLLAVPVVVALLVRDASGQSVCEVLLRHVSSHTMSPTIHTQIIAGYSQRACKECPSCAQQVEQQQAARHIESGVCLFFALLLSRCLRGPNG